MQTDQGNKRIHHTWPEELSTEEKARLYHFLGQRFGIPAEALDSHSWFKRAGHVYILRRSAHLEPSMRYKVANVGMKVLGIQASEKGVYYSLGKWFVMGLGKYVRKGRVVLKEEQIEVLKREGLNIQPDSIPDGAPGPIIVAVEGIGDVGIANYKEGILKVRSIWI
jgi:hypothetical protein